MRKIPWCVLLAISSWSPAKGAIQNLSLRQALDLAAKKNLDLASSILQYEQDTINYNNAWRSFYLPNISLNTTSSSGLTLGSYPGTPSGATLPSGRNTGYPQSQIGLSLGNYTLFNFFRDRIAFDNARLAFERSGQVLEETRRRINFQIISAYFNARLSQEKLEAAERSLLTSRMIVRLVKSRVDLGEAPATELSSVEVDANDALLQVNTLKAEYQSNILNFTALLNQTAETSLNLTTPLSFKPVTLSYADAINWYKEKSPSMRGAKLSQQTSQGNLEIQEKNRLPLPTVTFSGVTVSYGNRYTGGSTSYQGASTGPGNIDVEASVNLTLPILGPGGLFNKDTVRSARIAVDQADLAYQRNLISGELQIRGQIFQLTQLEDRLKTLKLNFDASAALLGKIVSNISSAKGNRLELRDAVERARNSEIDLLQNEFIHIQQKNGLYDFIGKDWDGE